MALECSALLGLHVTQALTSVPRITHRMCVAVHLCAPVVRWFLPSIRETRVVWVCDCTRCLGLETSPPLTLSPKGVRRACTFLCGLEAQDLWWCGCASS